MKTSFTIAIVILSASLVMFGQSNRQGTGSTDPLTRLQQKEMTGNVILSFDSLIIENYNKHLVQNSKNRGVEGYRIRIFSDNGQGAKDHQMQVRAKFLSIYPDIPTYPKYEGSYYKVYVGNFRTRRDAMKILDTIRRNFPDAFIVEYKIVL
ncbi:MAG: SPOR domain-containing protein [Bacteroidales bacterium]